MALKRRDEVLLRTFIHPRRQFAFRDSILSFQSGRLCWGPWGSGEEVSVWLCSMLEVVPKDSSGALRSPHLAPVATVSPFSFLSLLLPPTTWFILKILGKTPGWES